MKVKRNVEQALAEARSELSHGDYLTLCASLTFLNQEIPEASVSDGDIFYMLGWLTQVSEGMGIDYTKHEAGKAVFHAEGKKHDFCITGMDIKTPEGRAAELCRIQRELNEYLCDFEVAFRCSKPGVFQNLKEKGEQMDKEDFLSTLESKLSDMAMLYIDTNQTDEKLKQRQTELQEELNEIRHVIFAAILTSGNWSWETWCLYRDLILSPTVDAVTSQLLVSAVTLACTTVFSFQKFDLLKTVFEEAKDEELKQRALIGLLLASTRMPKGVCEKEYREELEIEYPKLILEIQKQLAMTLKSEMLSQEYTDSFRDRISNRMIGALKHSIAKHADDDLKDLLADDGIGNEDDDEADNVRMSDDGKRIDIEMAEDVDAQEMMEKGMDILLGQFNKLSDHPFFEEISNWFLPFDENQPILAEAAAIDTKNDTDRMFTTTANRSCAADAYALAVLMLNHPDDIPEVPEMAKHDDDEFEDDEELEDEETFEGDSEDGDEQDDEAEDDSEDDSDDETPDDPETEICMIRTRYLRNLLRFYRFCFNRDEFFNVFEDDKDEVPGYAVLASPVFQYPFFDSYRLVAARYATRLEVPSMVGALLNDMEANDLETHYMKGWSLMKKKGEKNLMMAVIHFKKMLEIQPGMKKVYSMLADCYHDLNMLEPYLEVYDELLKKGDSLSDDFKKLLKIQKMNMLFKAKHYEDAIGLGYDLEYHYPDLELVSAMLSYCLLKRKGENAEESFQKAKERIGAYFADEVDIAKLMEGAGPNQNLEQIFASTMGLFLKMMQKDKEAEFINSYSYCLVYMVEGNPEMALDKMLRILTTCKRSTGKLDEMLRNDREWLEEHGVSWEDALLLYNYAVHDFENMIHGISEIFDDKKKKER